MRENFCEKLGIHATSDFRKYLGFPIRHRGSDRNRFKFIVERVMPKLASWKAGFLSFADRTVLIKSVMSAIPTYVMQGAALLSHLCEKLERVNRNFLWGTTDEKRNIHLVGWNKVLKSKEEGGLGILASKGKNIALLVKLNWRMLQEKEALWAKVILNKYCSASRRRANDPDKLPSSPNWQAIKLGFLTFAKGIGMRIDNGEKTSVWYDRWVKGKTLRELIEGPLPLTEGSLKVADLIQNQAWNWNLISFDLPQAIKDSIRATPLQIFNQGEDSII